MFVKIVNLFLDPVGSLVSTLLVSCWLLVGCHTFSKLVNFECVAMEECRIGRVKDWKSVGLEECRIGRV